jgi:hypothetical protein
LVIKEIIQCGEGIWSSESIEFFKKHVSTGTKCNAHLYEYDTNTNCLFVDLYFKNNSVRKLMSQNGYAVELK